MKIPLEYEDVIDNKFYTWSDKLSPPFKKLHFTPNMITTLGLICTIFMIYFICNNQCYIAAALYIASYFFDCMDGHFARKYEMTSKFGDYYDHVSDWIRSIVVVLMILYSCKCNNTYIPIVVLLVLFVLANIKQAYQDKYYQIKSGKNETESLGFLQKIVSPGDDIESVEDGIKKLKYTGWGVFTVGAAYFLMTCSDLDIGSLFESIKNGLAGSDD